MGPSRSCASRMAFRVASVAATLHSFGPWSGGVRLRHFGGKPLIEDNSVRSPASTLVNLNVGYRASSRVQVRVELMNLFNRKVSDVDYYYASRLRNEAGPVNDIHTHPAEPRALRLTVKSAF